MTLATKYRPTVFADIAGQGLTPLVLQRMVEQDIPSGLLFVGPAGTGKTSAARIFASETAGNLVELDAGVTGSVAEIRALTDSLRFAAGRRTVVLDEAQSISREGWNALLKSLEEPTPGVTFIVITTEPKKIPPTIRSRLIAFEFRRLSADAVTDRLQHIAEAENFSAEPSLISAIVERSRGGMRQAITHLERCMYAGVTDAETFLQAEGIADVGPLLVDAIASGDPGLTERALASALRSSRTPQVISSSLISTLRDLQVLRVGGTVEAAGAALERRQALAQVLTPEAVFAALSVLWQFQTMLASSEDPATDLRLVCAILEKHLHVGRKILG